MLIKKLGIILLLLALILSVVFFLAFVLKEDLYIEINFETYDGDSIESIYYDPEKRIPTLPKGRKDGYYFVNWYLDETHTILVKDLANIEKNTTLYAKYEIRDYTISYYNIFEDSEDYPTSYTINSDDITFFEPKRFGYKFAGWYANERLLGQPLTGTLKGDIGKLDLYAKWQPKYDYYRNNLFNEATVNFTKKNIEDYNSYLYLDGNAYAKSAENILIAEEMTYEVWLKSSISGSYYIIDHRNQNQGIMVYLHSDGAITVENGKGEKVITSKNIFKFDNDWHHLACVATSDYIKIYYDGKLVKTDNKVGIQDTSAYLLYIGASNNLDNTTMFKGAIDDVKVWSVAKEIQAVQAFMQSEIKKEDENLLAYLSFNQLPESLSAHDSPIDYFNGEILYDNNIKNTPGSLNFNVDNYASINDVEIYNEVTYEVWNKSPSNPRNQFILDQRSDNIGVQPMFISNTGRIQFHYYLNQGFTLDTEEGVYKFDGQWHHIAVTADANSVKIYYDGELVAETDEWGISPMSARTLYLGASHNDSVYLRGQIDELRIYNKVKTEEEIKATMFTELSGYEENLVLYYDFNYNLLDRTYNHNPCIYGRMIILDPSIITLSYSIYGRKFTDLPNG